MYDPVDVRISVSNKRQVLWGEDGGLGGGGVFVKVFDFFSWFYISLIFYSSNISC